MEAISVDVIQDKWQRLLVPLGLGLMQLAIGVVAAQWQPVFASPLQVEAADRALALSD